LERKVTCRKSICLHCFISWATNSLTGVIADEQDTCSENSNDITYQIARAVFLYFGVINILSQDK
jgi:hypothetical protein